MCACRDKFTIISPLHDKFISWGRNESGQLGNGNREPKDKPRHVPSSTALIQVCAGVDFAVALSKEGDVLTWGANRKGQLGNGQFTSSCVPQPIALLRHRPVVAIACGEAHTLVRTIGGHVYAWGDNR
jgi:alpha-tubulin suppressor-like RCC1 family protein